ncbi:hypothetical protein JW992_09535 [candidate division KSB1 bacterium]|nr:hypothetical protein [candidate division KSB1 bacterium]
MIPGAVLLVPVALFIAIGFVHLTLWRWRKPQQEIQALFALFVLVPVLLGFALGLATDCGRGALTPIDCALALLLYSALAAAYVQTYPALQACSPSLYIAYWLGSQNTPVRETEIVGHFVEQGILQHRLEDLRREGFIRIDESTGAVALSTKGRFLARLFVVYRRLIGLEEGKG